MSRQQRKVQSSSSLRVMERNVQYASLRPPVSATVNVEPYEVVEEMPSIHDQPETVSRLPQLSELINLKLRPADKPLHEKIVEVVKYAQQLENTIKYKNKQIERLEYIIKYNQIGQQKRDIMIQIIQEENRKLKEQLILQDQTQKRKLRDTQFTLTNHEPIKEPNLVLKNNIAVQPAMNASQPLKTRAREIQDDVVQGLLQFEVESNDQIAHRYASIPHTLQLYDILGSHYDDFESNIANLTTALSTQFFDGLHQTLQEHKLMFTVMARLRKLIDMALQLSQQPSLNQSLDIVVKEACGCLFSDRASVFVFDSEKEQLWTRAQKGQNVIRIPYTKGIAGHVFTSGQLVNIMNAYSDTRFDQQADKANNYRTHTILSCPIMDPSNTTTLGVLQAINKLAGYFTKDDEKIIKLIASIAGISLRNALQFDEQVIYYNSLRNLLTVYEHLCGIQTIEQLVNEGEAKLKDLFNVQLSRIFVVKGERMIGYINGRREEFDSDLGIAGQAVINQQFVNIFNPYQNQLFNNQVDIETTLPLYCLPAKNPIQVTEIVAVLQVINARGIQSVSTQQKHKVASIDYEVLNNFGQMIARKLISLKEYNDLTLKR